MNELLIQEPRLLPVPGSQASPDADILDMLDARRFDLTKLIEPPEPRFQLGGVGFSTAGNLTVLAAGIKAGKSAFLGAMVSAVLTNPSANADCLGVSSHNPHGHALIHLDTEQSCFDHQQMILRVLRRAVVEQPPNWFLSYSLVGMTPPQLLRSVRSLLARAVGDFNGVHSLFIDGFADLVADVNDPVECNRLVAELQGFAVEFDCSIIGAIHLNPGQPTKTRGHLGSQLERKAETNLQLQQSGSVTTVWGERNRHAPIPKSAGHRFAWSEASDMHVSVTALAADRDKSRADELRQLAREVFESSPDMTWKQVTSEISRICNIGQSGARKKLDAMMNDRFVIKLPAGVYHLA